MSGMIGSEAPERERRFGGILTEVLFECLLETEELFLYLLVPLILVLGLYVVAFVVYQLAFNPNAVDVASRLDMLSIDPDKWFRPSEGPKPKNAPLGSKSRK